MLARQKSLVGLDIGSTAVKVVELRPLPAGGCDLSSFGAEPLPPDAVVEGTIIAKIPVADVDAFALQNAYELNYAPQADRVAALLDIGSSTMSLSVVLGNEFLFTRDITIGTHHYIDFLQKEMRVTDETAERLQRGEFES